MSLQSSICGGISGLGKLKIKGDYTDKLAIFS